MKRDEAGQPASMLRRLISRATEGSSKLDEPMEQRSSVSVVIPLYNHADYVDYAIDSALAEGDALHELIIIDDGSTDGSPAIARARAQTDSRVVFWTQPNQGAHAALNAGISRATSTYVAILNSDDAFRPGRLAALSAALDGDPNVWMATSSIDFIDSNGRATSNAWHESALTFAAQNIDLGTALLNGNILVSTSNFLIRREAIERVGLFAPLRYAHDLDFALRILLLGGKIANLDTKLLEYRMHSTNTIAEDHELVRQEWAMTAGAYLLGISGRTHDEPSEWNRLRTLLQVLDDHKLLRAAMLCAAYLRAHPPVTLAHSPITRDKAFRETLTGCV